MRVHAPAFPSNSFLDVRGAVFGNHGVVQAFTKNVPASSNQQWNFNNVQVQGAGFQCVTVPPGGYTNQSPLSLAACTGQNQSWQVLTSGEASTISFGSFCWDVPFGQATDHNAVQLFTCNLGNNQKFTFTKSGQITFGGKCVDVDPNGRLQLFPCKSSGDITKANQLWNLHGPIVGIGSNCLDITGGDAFDGASLQTFQCNGGANQSFDYFFN